MVPKYEFNTTRARSALMSRIRSSNTAPEITLRKNLHAKGIRFRINQKYFGNPDISIKKYKLVIFVDGEFWHGFNWAEKKDKISSNRGYWIPKIEKNIYRDQIVNNYYKSLGWKVLRFWEKEIKQNLEEVVDRIIQEIEK